MISVHTFQEDVSHTLLTDQKIVTGFTFGCKNKEILFTAYMSFDRVLLAQNCIRWVCVIEASVPK